MPTQEFGRCKRLDRLAEPHFVGNDRAPRACGGQPALGLVGIQLLAQQRLQCGAGRPLRVEPCELCLARLGIEVGRDEFADVVVDAQIMACSVRCPDESRELAEPVLRQHPNAGGIEQSPGAP